MRLYPELISEDIDFVKKVLVFFEDGFEFLARVEDCRMIASGEDVSDTLISIVHTILEEVHSNLTGNHIFFPAIVSEDGAFFYTEMT